MEKKSDVFVNLPTGFRKSLIYQSSPLIVDTILKLSGHIILVLPLINFLQEQVLYLQSVGISSISLSTVKGKERKDAEEGIFSIVCYS